MMSVEKEDKAALPLKRPIHSRWSLLWRRPACLRQPRRLAVLAATRSSLEPRNRLDKCLVWPFPRWTSHRCCPSEARRGRTLAAQDAGACSFDLLTDHPDDDDEDRATGGI